MSKALMTFANYMKPELQKFWHYSKVELRPPTPKEVIQIGGSISHIIRTFKSNGWKQITVKQAWLNLLVAAEVGCWFYIGECIGKGSLVGYQLGISSH